MTIERRNNLPYPEETVCADPACGHPLRAHSDGLRNPHRHLGPEWPTGCEEIVGYDEAGSATCACRTFVAPVGARTNSPESVLHDWVACCSRCAAATPWPSTAPART